MAKNIGRVLRLFGTNINVVTTADDEPSCTHSRPAILEIVPFAGGGITPSLLEEEDFQEHDQKGEKSCTVDDHVDTLPIVDDDVDASFKLSTSVSRNSVLQPVYSAMPLPCIPPGIVPVADFWHQGYDGYYVGISGNDQADGRSSLSRAGCDDEKRGKSANRKRDNVGDEKKRRSVKRKRNNGADDHPIPSLEDIPGLLEIIESRNGTRPVFVYQKKLEESDVSEHLNRLFMTTREELMKFLTEDEAKAVNDTKDGVQIVAVDPQRELYTLGLRIWQSLKMMVVNSDWNKLVIGNNAQKGDLIQMWGYRENDKPHFAISIRKCEANSGSTS